MLLSVAGVSVVMDLHRMRVSNGWIVCSLLAGFVLCMAEKGWRGTPEFLFGAALPLAAVGWLYYFRMLGPGDVKLFCALGGIMGPQDILKCIGFSFLCGAAVSLAILTFCGGFRQRFTYLLEYLETYLQTGVPEPYYKKGTAWENIHFTVPVFMSVMLYAGGIY